MPRIVALDVGDATIGIAATDELEIIASPLRTLHRTKSIKADLRALEEVLSELDARKVIVGLPLSIDGEEGLQAQKVKDFSNRLARRLSIPVEYWDESLSSVEAEDILIGNDASRARRKKAIHGAAAAVILDSYMNAGSRKQGTGSGEWQSD